MGEMNLLVKLDRLAGPDVNYAAYTFREQIKSHLHKIRHRQAALSSAILLLRLCIFHVLSVALTPVSLLLRVLGFVFLSVNLDQVGGIHFLDGAIRRDRLKGGTPRWKFLVCRSRFSKANQFALDLYQPYVCFIEHPLAKLLLAPLFLNPFFKTDIEELDSGGSFGDPADGKKTYFYEIFNAYADRHPHPLIRLSDRHKQAARAQLSGLLTDDRPFVVLHVRDSGFYGDKNRVTRNADVTTYLPAIEYLVKRGYTVVRIGDASAAPIDHMIERCGRYLVDYARAGVNSDLLDVYLLSECAFFIGCASGPWSLAIVLETPCCNVNFYTAGTGLGSLSRDLTTFKKIRRKEDGALVPFEACLHPPFSQNPQLYVLDRHGCYLEDNSPEEILDTIREFVERKDETPSELQLHAKRLLKPYVFSYEARGQYSNVILRQYFPEHEGKP